MVKQGYNYLDGSIQSMAEFFETKIKNLQMFDNKKDFNKGQKVKLKLTHRSNQ